MKQLLVTGSLAFISFLCPAQENWKLTGDQDGIRSWSRKIPDSRINAVKLEAVFNTSLSGITGVIADVARYDSWVFNSRGSRLLKQVSPSELYYYSEVIFPWPATNRDFVSHIQVSQDAVTKVVTINANNVSGWEPVHPKRVRINQSNGKWTLTPISNKEVKAEYVLLVDPGGELPAWIINSFSSKGLVQTFKNLRSLLQQTKKSVVHPGIED
ncbi:MAG: lipid-binding protein [Bacteroidetes bacterium]|nr:lipid-binding protein [Bacteroidota bacterium]